jgi:hypothetical protein
MLILHYFWFDVVSNEHDRRVSDLTRAHRRALRARSNQPPLGGAGRRFTRVRSR